jgi:hypothetical protein
MKATEWTRTVLGGCLLVEGVSTALWLASRLPLLAAYDGLTLAVVGARGVCGGLALMSWAFLRRRSHAGLTLAPWVLVGSATLYALEIGARLRPSSVYPGARWILVVTYTVYALGAAALLVRLRRRASSP